MTPEMDVGMMVKSDVAVAPSAENPKPSLKTGTRMVPPPMPSMPDRMPTHKPTTRKAKAAPMNASKGSGVVQVKADLAGGTRIHIRLTSRNLRLCCCIRHLQRSLLLEQC